MLEEWAPANESALYAEEDAADEPTAAADEIAIPPSIPQEEEDQDGQDEIDKLSDTLQRAIEEAEWSSAEAVDSNVDGDVDEYVNEGVNGGAKVTEVMAVTAPSEGGDIALEENMAQPLPG